MAAVFDDKASARRAVWDALQRERAARFPYPPHGRIPNFAGAEAAARRLADSGILDGVHHAKANPDAPQKPLRAIALARGITLYMPSPRLRAGFWRLDPARIPPDRLNEAASLSRARTWAQAVPLPELPAMDLVMTGSVAVTRAGKRCGKGHGYGDIEYALLRELGHAPAPVATTVHPLQLLDDFPADPHDLPVSTIATPEAVTPVPDPPPGPAGIDWSALPADAPETMPVLAELQDSRTP